MAHALDAVTVLDLDGHPVRLGDLWRGRSIVLLFVRHFGCLFCRQQITEAAAHLAPIRALGAELVVVGNGTLSEARDFRDQHQLRMPLFTNPGGQAYAAAGMRRGWRTNLTPVVALCAVRALRQGFRQTFVAGDPLQQGGIVVIGPRGLEQYRYVSTTAGDHPPFADVVAALAR
jgi:peroxiredoxin